MCLVILTLAACLLRPAPSHFRARLAPQIFHARGRRTMDLIDVKASSGAERSRKQEALANATGIRVLQLDFVIHRQKGCGRHPR